MTKFLAPVLVALPLLGAVGTQAIAAPCGAGYFRDGNGDCRYYAHGEAGTSNSYFMAPLIQQPSVVPAQLQPSQFIGPYELHDGLLPNGLTPNPPTYG